MDTITILFENEAVVVVNKPAGLLVHPTHVSEDEPTLVDWFCEKYPESKEVGETQTLADGSVIARPGVVHRLDKETSGVLVMAKTNEAHALLKEQFVSRTVSKEYLALVYGEVSGAEWVVERPLTKHAKDFRRYTSRDGRGVSREATTAFVVTERYERYTLLRALPATGRTHQIRVHLADEGYPIVCDRLYGRGRLCPLAGLTRQALHAAHLSFTDPKTGQLVEIEAPLPLDITEAIASLVPLC